MDGKKKVEEERDGEEEERREGWRDGGKQGGKEGGRKECTNEQINKEGREDPMSRKEDQWGVASLTSQGHESWQRPPAKPGPIQHCVHPPLAWLTQIKRQHPGECICTDCGD